ITTHHTARIAEGQLGVQLVEYRKLEAEHASELRQQGTAGDDVMIGRDSLARGETHALNAPTGRIHSHDAIADESYAGGYCSLEKPRAERDGVEASGTTNVQHGDRVRREVRKGAMNIITQQQIRTDRLIGVPLGRRRPIWPVGWMLSNCA